MFARQLLLFPLFLIACDGGAAPVDDVGAADRTVEVSADVIDDGHRAVDGPPTVEEILVDGADDTGPPPEVFDLMDLDEEILPGVPADIAPDVPPEDVAEEVFEYAWQPDGPCGTPSYGGWADLYCLLRSTVIYC